MFRGANQLRTGLLMKNTYFVDTTLSTLEAWPEEDDQLQFNSFDYCNENAAFDSLSLSATIPQLWNCEGTNSIVMKASRTVGRVF